MRHLEGKKRVFWKVVLQKLLCKNKTTYFLLNTISINQEPFKKQVGENTFKRITEISNKKDIKFVAFRAGVNARIAELSE